MQNAFTAQALPQVDAAGKGWSALETPFELAHVVFTEYLTVMLLVPSFAQFLYEGIDKCPVAVLEVNV